MTDCIFCKIINKEISATIIEESKNFMAILDVNPKVKNHALILPKNHFENFLDFPIELGKELVEFSKKVIEIQTKTNPTKEFNLINNNGTKAGQIVPHWHLHILPRKKGDKFRVSV